MRLARSGDVFVDGDGDLVTILPGHGRRPGRLRARVADDVIDFYIEIPRDIAARDIAKPGALRAYADPWSTWTEDA